MFSSLKVKIQSILNPFQRRSHSICVQSKAKKIGSKRDQSETKSIYHPQQVEITPKKKFSKDKHMFPFDEMETTTKAYLHLPSATRLLQNRNNNHNQKWLDFVSDIESNGAQSDKLLLPTSEEMRSIEKNVELNNKNLGVEQPKQLKRAHTLPTYQNQRVLLKQDGQNTLIDELQQNKKQPQNLLAQSSNQKQKKQSKKNVIASEIKKKRKEQYQKQKYQLAKGIRNTCIVCQQQAIPRDSIHLTCAHRIHKYCSQLIKWKPRMRCAKCQRKSIKDLIFLRGNVNAKSRASQPKKQRK